MKRKIYDWFSFGKYRCKYSKSLVESFVLHVNDQEQADGVAGLSVHMVPFLVKVKG